MAAQPSAYPGYPAGAYDYSAAYYSDPAAYAAWYAHQQQQQQAHAGAPAPPPGQPPPLPAGEPPPLPPAQDAAQEQAAAAAAAAGGRAAGASGSAGGASAGDAAHQQQQQHYSQQQQHAAAAAYYAQHNYQQHHAYHQQQQAAAASWGQQHYPPSQGAPYGWGPAPHGYGQHPQHHQPPGYPPPAGHAAAAAHHQHHNAAPYGPTYGGQQQQQPGHNAPSPGGGGSGAPPPPAPPPSSAPPLPSSTPPHPPHRAPSQVPTQQPPAAGAASGDYSRVPPPASLSAPYSISSKPLTIRPAGFAGSSGSKFQPAPAAAGSSGAGGGGTAQSSVLANMRAAAQAAAARMAPGGAQQQHMPAYVSVGGGAGGLASAPAAAAAAGASAPRPQPAVAGAAGGAAAAGLPASLTAYVTRVYSLVSKDAASLGAAKEAIHAIIRKHREDGTLWSTDWDRHPMCVPAGGGGSTQQQGGAGAAAAGGGYGAAAGRWQHGKDSSVFGRPGRDSVFGRLGSGAAEQKKKRSWGRRGSGSDDDASDDSRGSDGDDDDAYAFWGKSKRQRLQQQQQGGRGAGRHAKQQQQKGSRGAKGAAGRGGKQQQRQQQQSGLTPEEAAKAAARGARFRTSSGAQLAAYGWQDDASGGDAWDGLAAGAFIVGTSAKLEKRYLRLTRPPLPEEVRPQAVLSAALDRLLGLMASKGERYLYYNDQLKAMRQDLTVQGIRSEFTVRVYEVHARAALEYGDNAEYNQCQTQLAQLYGAGLPGAHAEFAAYRLLYQAVFAAHGEGRKLLGTLRQLLGGRVGAEVPGSPEFRHAMQVRAALAAGNTTAFFRLYASAPRLGRRLMDAAVKTLRFNTLQRLVRAHKPAPLPLPFLASALGFAPAPPPEQQQQDGGGVGGGAGCTVDAAGALLPGCSERLCEGDFPPPATAAAGLADALEWAKARNCMFDQETDPASALLLTKECWGRLLEPVDQSKVAHGDVNLDITDFLAVALTPFGA